MIFSRKTKFVGGGLINPYILCREVSSPDNFTNPAYVDGRPYCIEASNQGQTPHCAGYTAAGMKEVEHWKTTGIKQQRDGDLCYAEAKKIDGMPKVEGTSLYHAAVAGKSLGWFTGEPRMITNEFNLRWALHRHGCCMAGFQIDSNWNSVSKGGWIGTKKNATSLGGHAVLVCYYDKDGVGFQNSWGDWGWGGFGRMTWTQFRATFMHGLVME